LAWSQGKRLRGHVIRDAKRHKIDILTVSPRNQMMLGGEGLIVK
jgi:hypothetical protein